MRSRKCTNRQFDGRVANRNRRHPGSEIDQWTAGAWSSALYDPEQDVYFISNINGGLLDRDNNGSISRLQAATLSGDLKWIAGGKNNVTLDGPKGMAILGEFLYVSDVGGVRKFDRRTGAAKGLITLPGAVCINDLVSDGKNLYVSDTGIVPAAGETFSPSGTDAVWRIANDQATKLASGRDLLQPNGLAVAGGKLWAVTFGGNELYEITSGKKSNITTLPHGQLDGIVVLPDGSFAITSWQSKTIYRGKPGGPFEPLLESVLIPADLGYDGRRHLLLVPNSAANAVTMHPVR